LNGNDSRVAPREVYIGTLASAKHKQKAAVSFYCGLDVKRFQVVADFPVGGTPAGTNLASQFKVANSGVWELKLSRPITKLPKGDLTVSVQDHQGNVTRIERTFSVR